jgi:eukaryotic-like serine/threonine-protein kinase
MSPNKFVKICPECSSTNDVYNRRCTVCGRSLAGVVPQLDPSQVPAPNDEQLSHAGDVEDPLKQRKVEQAAALDKLSQLSQASGDTKLPPPFIGAPVSGNVPGTSQGGNFTKRTISRRKRVWFAAIALVLITLIVFLSVFVSHRPRPQTGGIHSGATGALSGLGEFKASNGQLLGVNDGSFAPFMLGPDGQLKQQAVVQLKQKHGSQAISLWLAALHITNNDAEAWIYLENQSVLLSGLPYITLAVGTDLFEPQGSDLSALRGVYVAQHEFNNDNHGFKLRILIANSGTDTTNVSAIAQQIANIAKQDKTVVGVVSWLTSTENLSALPNLSNSHIPVISPLAASDALTNASPYFFRIISPNKIQGKLSALFVEQTLHAKKVVIFVDNNDSYSQNVAQVFENQFENDSNTILKVEPFTTDKTSNIKSLIQDALATKPDLLFFTGRDVGDAANFQDALPTSGPFAALPALAGGAGYVIHKAGYGRWYFDADAFPDELNNVVGNSSPQPPFYQDYSNAFNEDGRKPAGYYGYTRPDSYAMLSYDVTSVFLNALQTVVANNNITLTTDGLKHITPTILALALPHVTLQGVSGWIAFDSMGNPVNKAIVFLAVSLDGHTYMKDWRGCFTKSLCHSGS